MSPLCKVFLAIEALGARAIFRPRRGCRHTKGQQTAVAKSEGSRRNRSGLKRRRTFQLRPIRRHKRQTRTKRDLRAHQASQHECKSGLNRPMLIHRCLTPFYRFDNVHHQLSFATKIRWRRHRLPTGSTPQGFIRSVTCVSLHPFKENSAFFVCHTDGDRGNCF